MNLIFTFFVSKLSWRVDAAQFDYSGEPEPTYSCISPIRCILRSCISSFASRALMLREKDPQRWQMVWSLMSHKEARQKMSYWTEKHEPIMKLIRYDQLTIISCKFLINFL